jgi:hypothetical protein
VRVHKNKCGKKYINLPPGFFQTLYPVSSSVATFSYTSGTSTVTTVGPFPASRFAQLSAIGTLTSAVGGTFTITVNRGTIQVATISVTAGATEATPFAISFTDSVTYGNYSYSLTVTGPTAATIDNVLLSGTYM